MNTKKRFLSTYVSLETIPHIELSLELFGLGVGSVFNMQGSTQISLREKCPYSEFFRSVFSRIWTEYGEILCISPNTDKLRIRALHAVKIYLIQVLLVLG